MPRKIGKPKKMTAHTGAKMSGKGMPRPMNRKGMAAAMKSKGR